MNPRAIAGQCLHKVIYEGKSLTEVLKSDLIVSLEGAKDNPSVPKNTNSDSTDNRGNTNNTDNTDKALIKDICFGSLRWHYAINQVLDKLLTKPLKKKDKDVECLIRVGIYQLHYQHTADHAAVNETVAACKKLKKPWSTGLVNGVLRNFIRDQENLVGKIKPHTVFPIWLIKRVKQAWPNQWKEVLVASNLRAPMTLRVNQSKVSVKSYIKQLGLEATKHIEAQQHSKVDSAIELKKAVNVYDLPNFDKGHVSVQDASAQLAAKLLDCKAGMRVLDACAAPGGKTGHILETAENLSVTAIDNVPERLNLVQENLERLGQQAKLVVADATKLEDWYDQQTFDRILLDAPCSALGVMRRHPDIKILRQESDIRPLLELQNQLLTTLWTILKPGGFLLYATCSILPEENDQQIAEFVESHSGDVKVIPLTENWGFSCEFGRQILPGSDNMDGFYYSLLQKPEL